MRHILIGMRSSTAALACVVTMTCLGAQAQTDKPYHEGSAHEFLQRARENKRPAIVLFNFNLESG